ncbi:PhoX family phosphatase [Mycobacterium sp. Y57]|uniref:PhoX family protein n=1 Tax=Mycolicibacterium xanthum TaxID=2796469 RepID=UPI001C85FCB9|nr:PhoX family phosphatase [Mycolicibacterium xanthum]MBX7434188.1 PhoX family phosphatase [Mycolicibacterium xanthum]
MALIPLNSICQHSGESGRRRVTSQYRCGEACSRPPSNTSDNEYFGDIAKAVSRRTVLRAGAIMVLSVSAASAVAACSRGDGQSATPTGAPAQGPDAAPPSPGLNFAAVAPNTEDAVVIPEGYRQAVVIRWGDPVLPEAPEWDVNAQTGAAQALQFGFNNDFAALMPLDEVPGHSLFVISHEYTDELFMFPGFDPESYTRGQFEVCKAAHGLSVLEVEPGSDGGLNPLIGRYNRRLTADSPFVLAGPAAGSPLTKTKDDPTGREVLGTLHNCSGGVTPWGTILSGEENFNRYFGVPKGQQASIDPVTLDRLKRYGMEEGPSRRQWERFEARFNLRDELNETNRFGYIVELDPYDPSSTPVKHTALGRSQHEGANIWVTDDGTVVAYSGDDETFEYMYKFLSSKKIQPGRDPAALAHNMTILDEGTLYVAKLSGNAPPEEINGSGTLPSSGSFSGTGTWIPLLRALPDGAGESMVPGMSAAEVAVYTRIAGDKVGATKMDRPEDFEASPKTGKVYVALTKNSLRGTDQELAVDESNPRVENKNGQVLELIDNHAGTDFTWNLLLVCGDPEAADSYYGGFDKSQVSPISCPDNLAFDSFGNLWIATDGNALNANDGLFAVVLEGPNRGETKQFLTVPIAGETCGPVVTDDLVTVCVQHPGEGDEHSLDNPLSHWPDGGDAPARPSVVAVWNPNGRIGV